MLLGDGRSVQIVSEAAGRAIFKAEMMVGINEFLWILYLFFNSYNDEGVCENNVRYLRYTV